MHNSLDTLQFQAINEKQSWSNIHCNSVQYAQDVIDPSKSCASKYVTPPYLSDFYINVHTFQGSAVSLLF